ncbi:MAG: trehalase family glycosidase [Chloroflexia bacterium]
MDYAGVLAYIESYWPRITRTNQRDKETLIGLPRPYLIPSDGHMFGEMYYWDSYFMGLGVAGTEREQLIVDMAENMAALFRRFGVIPNGSRYYFLSRSQPPFFTAQIMLAYELMQRRGDAAADGWLRKMMRLAEREHERVWLGTQQPHARLVHAGLSRYFDTNFLDYLASCESGWDHSTRCDDRWLAHLPVDLNAILYSREQDFARAAEILEQPRRAEEWGALASARAETMTRLMWDEEAGFFFDYDYENERRNPHLSLAGFYPLWAGLATPEQAERAVTGVLPRFMFPGGLVTTLEQREGRQWAYPNGWAPLQWLVVAGLERYGYTGEAAAIMRAWCDNCAAVFAATGEMWEKYNVVEIGTQPEGGVYGMVIGFGWTNAVFADFARRLGADL